MVKFILALSLIFSLNAQAKAKKILVILSENKSLPLQDGKSYQTGNYLNEFAIPLMALIDAGFEPVYLTPTGKLPALDKDSVTSKYFNKDEKIFNRALKIFNAIGNSQPLLSLTKVQGFEPEEIGAIFIPGGHAPVIDLAVDPNLGKLLRWAHENKIVTALICHGPIAILSALKDPKPMLKFLAEGKISEAKEFAKDWPYKDYAMTIFSSIEEKMAEKGKLNGMMLYYPSDALILAGGKNISAESWSSHVVVDRELITGQNPNSVNEFSEKLIAAIKAKIAI
ncbi:MAG: type 1 glutamine amidotransferase domain-containing protein [Bacteriovoracaceae bacterium]|nr:type 1 glutamine amidotransferase domain-containing protein [Bacteriovoracaceae bacterium]